MGVDKDVIVGGWSSAPYGTRIEKIFGFWTNHVGIKYRAISLRRACLPMTDIDDFMESVKYFPTMDSVTYGNRPVKGDTMMDIGFSNVNPVIHVPASLLRVSSMENWSFVYGNAPNSYIPCILTSFVRQYATFSINSIKRNAIYPKQLV